MVEILHSVILLVLVAVSDVSCHVVLTFPPARPFAFDFLDNVRSDGPCGTEYNKDHHMMTSVISGRPFKVSWHIAYPHMGGIKLQLMNTSGAILSELTDSQFIYENDTTSLSHEITIDGNIKCEHCVLRIIKQAAEWSNSRSSDGYLFWSCADISVLDETREEENDGCYEGKCLNGGSCAVGKCRCSGRFEGDRCENVNDCQENDECGHGRCIERKASSYPKKLCFCESGWMGRFCNNESSIKEAVLPQSEKSEYFKLELYKDPQFDLFWKIIEENQEIEIALRVQTDTWAAIGWRPDDVTATCKDFPKNILPEPEVEINGEKLSNDDEDNATDQSHEDPKEMDGEGPENRRRKRFSSWLKSRQRRALINKRNEHENVIKQLCEAGNVSAAAEWASLNFNKGMKTEESQSEPSVEPELTAEPEPTVEHEPASEPELTSEPEPTEEPDSPGQPEPESQSGPNYLHPMDCSDIIYAMAEGNLHHVVDGYTRDRSTPKPDHWYGGTSDLTAAAAKREDGVFHVRFRRKLRSDDVSDHSLLDSGVRLIWARGQTSYSFYHKPMSGLERCKASNYDYYNINELKYHGTKPSQRGSITHNFYDDPESNAIQSKEGLFKHPSDCKGDSCEYTAEWKYRSATKMIHFTIEAKVETEEWAAIGFSKNKQMEDSDAVVGWVDSSNGELTLTDRWLTEKSSEGVALDNGPSSLENARGNYNDGKLHISFSRLQDTKDPNDISLTECVYFIYAWGGGLRNGDLSKHRNTAVSEEKICIDAGSFATKTSASVLMMTVCFGFSFIFRMMFN